MSSEKTNQANKRQNYQPDLHLRNSLYSQVHYFQKFEDQNGNQNIDKNQRYSNSINNRINDSAIKLSKGAFSLTKNTFEANYFKILDFARMDFRKNNFQKRRNRA